MGTAGSDAGEFVQPSGVAVDAAVFAVDSHRVQKFTKSGTFLFQWGRYGFGDGQFEYPSDVAVDRVGGVLVVEPKMDVPAPDNSRVQKFNDAGAFLSKWGSHGRAPGQFILAQGIAADSVGNIYVADTGNHRIQKFRQVAVGVESKTWTRIKRLYRIGPTSK